MGTDVTDVKVLLISKEFFEKKRKKEKAQLAPPT